MKPGDICRVIGGDTALTYGSIVEVIAADKHNHLARCRLIMGDYRVLGAEAWHNRYGNIPLNYNKLTRMEEHP